MRLRICHLYDGLNLEYFLKMRVTYYVLLLGPVALLMTLVDSQEINSTLQTSEIYGVLVAHDGENVTFTCVTKGSRTIAWSSEEYIGSGGSRLELVSVQPGSILTVGTTVARLTKVSDISGSVVIVSELQIIVRSTNQQTSSVTCHSVGTGTENTTIFYMADDVSIRCGKYCPGEPMTCTCITASSSELAWESDEYFGRESILLFASNGTVPIANSDAIARLTMVSDKNSVIVITSNITFLSVTEYIILTCRNVRRQRSHTVLVSIADDCVSPPLVTSYLEMTTHSESTTVPTTNVPTTRIQHSSVVTVAVTIIVLLVVIVIIATVTVTIWVINPKKNCKNYSIQESGTQLSVRNLRSKVFPSEEETPPSSNTQEITVFPSEEETPPSSNTQEITITDLQSENITLKKKVVDLQAKINASEKKVGDLQAEINASEKKVKCLQTENERLREKESVNKTVVHEKYNKLNMVDDVIGVMETDITYINYKKEILEDEVVQLKAELIDKKQQYPQDGAGAMECNVIKVKRTHDDDEDYKTFKKDKK